MGRHIIRLLGGLVEDHVVPRKPLLAWAPGLSTPVPKEADTPRPEPLRQPESYPSPGLTRCPCGSVQPETRELATTGVYKTHPKSLVSEVPTDAAARMRGVAG